MQSQPSFLGLISSTPVKCFKEFAVPKFDETRVRIVWTSKKDLLLISNDKRELKFTA